MVSEGHYFIVSVGRASFSPEEGWVYWDPVKERSAMSTLTKPCIRLW